MSSRKQAVVTSIGFLLAGVGIFAIILSLVGLKLSYLVWLDRPGPLFGFVAKLVMIIAGFVMIYMAQTDLSKEEI